MQPIATPKNSAEIDAYMINTLSIPSLVLMEQAAAALAKEVMQRFAPPSKILVLAGKGNNGGDGFACARILLTHGYDVFCGAVDSAFTEDAEKSQKLLSLTARFGIIKDVPSFFSAHQDAVVIIDALFGTGLSRTPSGIYAEVIQEINRHPAYVISADIPSGVFGNTGEATLAVKADVTVTFQYPKPGHFLFPGKAFTGALTIAKIGVDEGIPPHTYFHVDSYKLKKRDPNTNKGSYGKLDLIAGSKGMAGAAVFAAKAALVSGAGRVHVGCPDFVTSVLQSTLPEATVSTLGSNPSLLSASNDEILSFHTGNALAIGPGLGKGEILPILEALLPLDTPKVLDADALNALAQNPSLLKSAKNAIITPHPKEFSRLSGMNVNEVLSNPVDAAVAFSKAYQVIVLLKGATSVITDGSVIYLVTAGSPGMAKGGSGDVLTGVIGALLAQGLSPIEAAYAGAYFAGKAGEAAALRYGEYSLTPSREIDALCFD